MILKLYQIWNISSWKLYLQKTETRLLFLVPTPADIYGTHPNGYILYKLVNLL